MEALEPRQLLAADVYISEFVASNDSYLDEDGDDSDWLEVFNAGPDEVDLGTWYLTDDAEELNKWEFPSHVLPAGRSTVVFASGKDRADADSELHTNFKLSAGGEYFALAKPVEDGSIQIVSEFAPEFPQQVTDVSYGFPQTSDNTVFLDDDSAARILVPVEEPSAGWTGLDFDDTSWIEGTAAIGYQETVPGFTVEQTQDMMFGFENLSEATELLDGTGRYGPEETRLVTPPVVSPTINFYDVEGEGGSGRFTDENLPFPGDNRFETLFTEEEINSFIEQGFSLDELRDDNFFALRASGTITIPESGMWTFHTNADDGVQVWIDGVSIIREDVLQFEAPTDSLAAVELEAGAHSIELVYFEYVLGASLELSAAPGEHTRYSRSRNFQLIGDVENGGLEVRTSPSGGDVQLSSLVNTDLGEAMSGEASTAYLRIPFEVEDPSELEALSLRMQYDGGFVAYLNGQEIARRNVADDVGFESTTLDGESRVDAVAPEDISIAEHIGLLNSGTNLLAIHGINDGKDSPDFLVSAEVIQSKTSRDADKPVFFRVPTPGAINASSGVQEFLHDDVSIGTAHGFYEEAFETDLVATSGTSIRYTTDGSAPTAENGMDYDGPITIDATTTLRARSFKDGSEPSNIETATYLFIADVLNQGTTPAGWPRGSSNGQILNYGMDPDITDDDEWGPQLAEALTQIPTMSIVMDVDDFVGADRGIYANANSHGRDWERPASLELINPDGSEGFYQDMGVRVRGGFSRTSSNPKHALRLFFREDYGDGQLDFPLFGEEGAEAFDKIDLRTSQNYSWAFQGDGRNTFMRDVFSRDIQGQMGQPYTRSSFYHLYINGQYWGLYQTQERAEARYAASYFGGDSDDYDVVKSAGSSGGYANEATDGNLDAYQRLWSMFQSGLGDDNSEEYWKAQGMNPDGSSNDDFERLLDVDNLIDYMIITYYTADADGPGSRFTRPRVNNYFGIYNRENPDGFKFFEHDSEHSLDTGNAAGANYNLVTPQLGDFPGSVLDYFNPHWMHEQLANNNSAYRERFQDAVYNRMFNDGPLAPENAVATLDARAAEIDMAIIAESARWGDSRSSNPYTKDDWVSAVETTRDWLDNRTDTVIGQLQDVGWYPEDGTPPQLSVNGDLRTGGDVLATDQLGFFSPLALALETVIPAGSTWHYSDTGVDLGSAWRESGFDDSTWKSGPAKLAYGESDAVTVIDSGEETRHLTAYFRTTFDVQDPANFAGGVASVLRDDGAVVYVNGVEIGRSNMPSGPVSFDTLASGNVTRDEDTFFPLDFLAGVLRSGENTIAVEVHQYRASTSSSADLAFDLELQLGSPSFENVDVYYTLDGSDPKLANGDPSPNATRFAGESFVIGGSADVVVRSLKDGEWSLANQAAFNVVEGSLLGDVNLDGLVDSGDIDALRSAIRNEDGDLVFDLNGDGAVDAADVESLLSDVLNARRGDLDLNGAVAFSDFLALSNSFGRTDAGWADGDIDGNGTVDFTDFLAFSEEFGAPPAAEAVERAFREPNDFAAVLAATQQTSHEASSDDELDETFDDRFAF